MKRLGLILTLLTTLFSVCMAQRRITPVTPPDPSAALHKKNEVKPSNEVDRSNLIESFDSKGNIVLVDTITGTEWVDSTAIRKVGYKYSRLHAVTIGLDVWDPVMRLTGQKYGIATLWGEISFHNRFKPVFEIGFSTAKDKPDGMNFTFRSPIAPYFKIGMNYNFLYNSNPDYQIYALARYGFTCYSYSLTDVAVADDYWGEQIPVDFPSRNTTAGFFELGLGVKVKIAGPLSLGWTAKFHGFLHETKSPEGEPMIIPGYGKRNSTITGGFSVMYTFGIGKQTEDTLVIE